MLLIDKFFIPIIEWTHRLRFVSPIVFTEEKSSPKQQRQRQRHLYSRHEGHLLVCFGFSIIGQEFGTYYNTKVSQSVKP
jgi:hypothetical protein